MTLTPIRSKCLLLTLNQAEVDLVVKALALVFHYTDGSPYSIPERRLAKMMLKALESEASYG